MKWYGGIEAGGTKIVCTVASGPGQVAAETRFATTTPVETIQKINAFFSEQSRQYSLTALGIGTFGPVDLDKTSPTYGFITTTPKPGWNNVDLLGGVQSVLQLPVAFDTDVNAAALGEFRWGSGQGLDPLVYFTIGTGIGMGALVNGGLLHGLTHPEAGHVLLPRDPEKDAYEGFCPYHKGCFEGLAAGPAINQRWGQKAETLPADHPAWNLEAHYIALAVVNVILTLSPRRIILGGGVMQQAHLFPMIRREVIGLLQGYVHSPAILEKMDDYIKPPGLGNQAGMLGCIALAQSLSV